MLSKYQHAVTIMAVVFLAGGIFMYTMSYLGRMHAAMKFGPMTTTEEGAAPGMEKQVQNALSESYASIGGFGGGRSSADSGESDKDGSFNLTESSSNESSKNSKTTEIPKTKININTANAKLLEELPGIGPVLAERIVLYRENNGFFSSPQELVNVKGIGEKKLEDIMPYVRVN